jgi:hypothetical protein
MTPTRYRKKPVVIEAMRLDEHNTKDVCDWVAGGQYRDPENQRGEKSVSYYAGGEVAIETLEGTMVADIGDFVIRGVKGEFYPCKPDIFEATYEACDG